MLGGWTDVIKVNTVAFGKENNSLLYNAYFIIYFFFVSLCFLNTLFGFLVDNVAANLDATIADQEEDDDKKSSASNATGNESQDGKGKPELGDLRDDLDSFVDLKDNKGEGKDDNENDKDAANEKEDVDSKVSFKKDEAYDPVDKVIKKIDA